VYESVAVKVDVDCCFGFRYSFSETLYAIRHLVRLDNWQASLMKARSTTIQLLSVANRRKDMRGPKVSFEQYKSLALSKRLSEYLAVIPFMAFKQSPSKEEDQCVTTEVSKKTATN
jgi:hypothetical protein